MEKTEEYSSDIPEAVSDVQETPASTYLKPQQRPLHDPTVTFEEYHYYALQTREEESQLIEPKTNWREVLLRKKPANVVSVESSEGREITKAVDEKLAHQGNRVDISDEEWKDASRALRTASWGGCFYLIMTDVLGPYGTGFAMGTLGWAPGIVLYTVFGGMAGYSGFLIWRTFLGLDSHFYPLRNYGDLAFRTWGSITRGAVNFLQALALLLILGQVTIQSGQSISQLSNFKICFAVCNVIFLGVGFAVGQVRTLRRLGWLTNFAFWLTLLVIFICMGVIANSPPNYSVAKLGSAGGTVAPETVTPVNGVYPAIMHYNNLPPDGFVGSLNGLSSAVLAYSGAQLFCEFMGEMRQPKNFIKSMWIAQTCIWAIYLIFGCFIYYYQGQYSYQVAFQGLSIRSWQIVGDVLTTISGWIAAGLYGNVGIKVVYNNFFVDYFNAPPLITRSGKLFWVILVPIYWSIAYAVASAIPSYFSFVSIISAIALLPLTYMVPPILALGYDIQMGAMKAAPENGFDPVTGQVTRRWTGLQRWVKGYFAGGPKAVLQNIWHTLYALGALTCSILLLYAAIKGMIEVFKIPQVNSFSCKSPLDLS